MASSLLHCSEKLPFMDVETILHMKEGIDETSYAQNSSLQKRGMDTLKSLIINSATDVYISQMPERFTVADLGCSSGPNALCLVEDIIGGIGKVCCRSSQPPPEFSVLLNDLPTNDFNTIFFSLPEFTHRLKSAAKSDEWGRPMVFLSGVPGSFYGRLFPRTSVHFICSCSSLHWLSQVPPGLFDEAKTPINKGKMYISSTSPPAVSVAYRRQFQRDFSLFLKSRAAEVFAGGRMVLAMLGRQTDDCVDRRTTFLCFHVACIDIWLKQHSTCPVCRVSLRNGPGRKHAAPPLQSAVIVIPPSSPEVSRSDPCRCLFSGRGHSPTTSSQVLTNEPGQANQIQVLCHPSAGQGNDVVPSEVGSPGENNNQTVKLNIESSRSWHAAMM